MVPSAAAHAPFTSRRRADGRSFSVNLHKNVFQCFDASCGAKGNVLDLWAQSHQMTIPQAARDLAERFGIITE